MHSYAIEGNVLDLATYCGAHPDISINQPDVLGKTPLHYAAANNQKQAAVWLLQHGADLSLRDAQGKTALDTALTVQHMDMVYLFGRVIFAGPENIAQEWHAYQSKLPAFFLDTEHDANINWGISHMDTGARIDPGLWTQTDIG